MPVSLVEKWYRFVHGIEQFRQPIGKSDYSYGMFNIVTRAEETEEQQPSSMGIYEVYRYNYDEVCLIHPQTNVKSYVARERLHTLIKV